MGIIQKILNSRVIERLRRKLALLSGIYIRFKRLSSSASDDYRTVRILKTYLFSKVIDVGANTGQFAESLIDFGYKGEILSFEPTSLAYNKLVKRASKFKNWKVAEKCAIGNFDGVIDINVSKNSVFSSIRNISTEYLSYNEDSKIMSTENVKIYKLDSLKNKYFNTSENIFLKIDTQGFEKEVLQGASEILDYVKGIKIEVPLKPIYDGTDWEITEILNFFKEREFKCISISEVAVNNMTGIVHEVDAIFIKQNLLHTTKNKLQ